MPSFASTNFLRLVSHAFIVLASRVLVAKEARLIRELRLMAYFRQCFPSNMSITTIKELAHALADHTPYQVSTSSIKIKHLHCEVCWVNWIVYVIDYLYGFELNLLLETWLIDVIFNEPPSLCKGHFSCEFYARYQVLKSSTVWMQPLLAWLLAQQILKRCLYVLALVCHIFIL